VRNEKELNRVKKGSNILHTVIIRKANWIGHILRGNCLQRYVIEGNIEGEDRNDGKTRKKM
jgi:hypothetical protein